MVAAERSAGERVAHGGQRRDRLIRKHKHLAEQMIEVLQTNSRLRLSRPGLRTADHPVWARSGWKIFLDHPDEIRRTVRYIEGNPGKWGLPEQRWAFVKPYDGWPLHAGTVRIRRMHGG